MKKLFRITTLVLLFVLVSCSDDSEDNPPASDFLLTELNGNSFYNSSVDIFVYFENNRIYLGIEKIENCWEMEEMPAQIINHSSSQVVYKIKYVDEEEFTLTITGSKSNIKFEVSADGEETISYSLSASEDCRRG